MSDFNQNRSLFIRILFVLAAVVIIGQLLFIQVFGAGGWGAAAQNQAIKRKVIHPARGLLIDRDSNVILNNNIFYDLSLQPAKMGEEFDTLLLCRQINVPVSNFLEKLELALIRNGPYKSSVVIKNLAPSAVARLQESISEFPGVDLVEKTQRTFPYSCGAHFIGYLNEVSKEMLKKEKYQEYRVGDYVGITGLENKYEKVLRGQLGVSYQLRDVKQRIVGSYKDGALDTAAVAGKDMHLYLDVELQKFTEELMANKLGSAVAIEPSTGGILSFVSAPSYKPELMTGPDKSKSYRKLLVDATKPLFNRAIMASYSPGSTFKPVTALVALDEGVINARYGYGCRGGYYSCGRKIGCTHYGGGHAASLRLAIAHSCNSYFCHVFRLTVDSPANNNVRLGLKRWGNYMNSFGLGRPIGIDLPSEGKGYIPDVGYFDRMYNKGKWSSCSMAMLGMGQGELLLTPLQMANSMCIIANRGFYKIPHFVKSIGTDSTHEMLQPYLKKNIVANIVDSNFEAVISGMKGVVDFGTARVARIPGIAVCGKTGTVENYRKVNGKKRKLRNHSMFVAFAPKDSPTIAVAVVVENSGYGAQWAGPIASLMIEKFINKKVKRKYLASRMKRAKIIPRITYLIDSLERKAWRERAQREKRRMDSLEWRKRKIDSIKKARGISLKNEQEVYFWNRHLILNPREEREYT